MSCLPSFYWSSKPLSLMPPPPPPPCSLSRAHHSGRIYTHLIIRLSFEHDENPSAAPLLPSTTSRALGFPTTKTSSQARPSVSRSFRARGGTLVSPRPKYQRQVSAPTDSLSFSAVRPLPVLHLRASSTPLQTTTAAAATRTTCLHPLHQTDHGFRDSQSAQTAQRYLR